MKHRSKSKIQYNTHIMLQQERQCTYKCNIVACSQNDCCCGKAISITYSECVSVALVIQHARRMCQIIVIWPIQIYHVFPHYLINSTIFKKQLQNTKCVFQFSLKLLSQTFLIVRKIQRDIIINVYWSSCKISIILVRF